MADARYSSVREAKNALHHLLACVTLPGPAKKALDRVSFISSRDFPYFPIPFKETELAAALKAVEGSLACALGSLNNGRSFGAVDIDLERTTAFLFQSYLATVDGYGKLDAEVKQYLKNTDLLEAQSDPYRRMSANLYSTKRSNEYYHIHGSLEASTTLNMIGLEPFRPDLATHEAIVEAIESKVDKFTVEELEALNRKYKQAGVPALKHMDYLKSPHGKVNALLPPWSVDRLEKDSPPCPLSGEGGRVLAGVKVLELCRVIAGPVMGRILAEYGADVLKITSPHLSDVPFFQVDGNMGKHAADLDLKNSEDREIFEQLLADADVVLDSYRPGALERLGFGPEALTALAKRRNRGIVYVNENCFGHEGEWAHRPGWQQIADCVTGLAWEQGRFMNLDEPVVPPFPISDYGTGCMGAIAALTGLYNRAASGGSWHGKVSLLHYDLLLFKIGELPLEVQRRLRERSGKEFLALRHSNNVDQISGTALRRLREIYPELFDSQKTMEVWYAHAYGAEVATVQPVVHIDGIDNTFQRASRPNGTDRPTWDFSGDRDTRRHS